MDVRVRLFGAYRTKQPYTPHPPMPLPRVSRTARPQHHLVWLFAGSMLLTACGITSGKDTEFKEPPRPPAIAPRGPLTIMLGIDTTGSYSKALIQSTDAQVASWIDQLPRPNTQPVTIYVTYIDHNPQATESNPLTYTIPAIPDQPAYPVFTPTPGGADCNNNQFSCAPAQDTVTAYDEQIATSYATLQSQAQQQLTQVRQGVHQWTNQLRGLSPAADTINTSLWGVLAIASDRFAGVKGEKYLLVASDWMNNTTIDQVPIQLNGVHVLALNLICAHAPECAATKQNWAAVLRQAGADVQFFDTEKTRTLTSPWQ